MTDLTLQEAFTLAAQGAADIEVSEDGGRRRLVVDAPADTAQPAVLLQDYTFGALAGNVRTMDHVREHFYTALYGGTDHHASNGEAQRYKADAVSVTDTELLLTADIIDPALGPVDGNISSGLVRTKKTGLIGYWEARMKLPRGLGFWPAFWLLASGGGWDAEIDIMENWDSPNEGLHKYHTAVHKGKQGPTRESKRDNWGAYWVAGKTAFEDHLDADYHTYGCEVMPGRIRLYFDDILVWDKVYHWEKNDGTPAAPADAIINLAVGSNTQAMPDETTPFPSSLAVKFLRVWDKRPTPRRVAEMANRPR